MSAQIAPKLAGGRVEQGGALLAIDHQHRRRSGLDHGGQAVALDLGPSSGLLGFVFALLQPMRRLGLLGDVFEQHGQLAAARPADTHDPGFKCAVGRAKPDGGVQGLPAGQHAFKRPRPEGLALLNDLRDAPPDHCPQT